MTISTSPTRVAEGGTTPSTWPPTAKTRSAGSAAPRRSWPGSSASSAPRSPSARRQPGTRTSRTSTSASWRSTCTSSARGIGSVLIAEHCRRLDAARHVGYLETDKRVNVDFYERFGYEIIGEMPVLGVQNWFMRRPATQQVAADKSRPGRDAPGRLRPRRNQTEAQRESA